MVWRNMNLMKQEVISYFLFYMKCAIFYYTVNKFFPACCESIFVTLQIYFDKPAFFLLAIFPFNFSYWRISPYFVYFYFHLFFVYEIKWPYILLNSICTRTKRKFKKMDFLKLKFISFFVIFKKSVRII